MRRLLLPAAALLLPTSAAAVELPFAAQSGLGSLTSATDVDVGDLDGDGDLDVVAVDFSTDTVAWLDNVDGTAAGVVTSHTATVDRLRWVQVVDMDRDGRLDVVIAAAGTADEVRIYWNAASNPWTTSTRVVNRSGPTGLAVGDLDQDGDPDIVMGRSNGNIYWYENPRTQATAAWTERGIQGAGGHSDGLDLADLDGDSDLDVVAALDDNGSGVGKIQWYENDLESGSTTWTMSEVETRNEARDVACADFDGDGDPDIVSVAHNGTGDDVRLHLNTGSGGSWTHSTIAATIAGATRVSVSDLDTDGDVDVLASPNTGTAIWYASSAVATAWTAHTVASSTGGSAVLAADFVGDGDRDLLIAGTGGIGLAANLRLHPEFSDGASSATVLIDDPQWVEPVDFDGDGDLDVLYCNRSTPNQVRWLSNDDGVGGAWTDDNLFNGSTSGSGLQEVRPADIDQDGDMDVLSVSAVNKKVIWVESVPIGTSPTGCTGPYCGYETIQSSVSFGAARGIEIGDIDADGDVDVLSTSFGNDRVYWFENDGPSTGGWTGTLLFPPPIDQPVDVELGDLDGDGTLDAVVAFSAATDEIRWYSNDNGDGSSWTSATVTGAANPTGFINGPSGLELADLDGDGDLDILAGGGTSGSFSYQGAYWFRNNSNGASWTATAIDSNYQPSVNRAVDVDYDGDLDVVVVNGTDIRWYENTNGLATQWTPHSVASMPAGTGGLAVADLDGDGVHDFLRGSRGNGALDDFQWFPGIVERTDTTTTDLAPGNTEELSTAAVLDIEIENLGGAGDVDLVLSALELDFANASGGAALTSGELQGLVSSVDVYRDDGDGSFSAASDALLVSSGTPTLSAGTMTLNPVTTNADAHFVADTPGTLFVTVTLTATADQSSIAAFTVTNRWAGTDVFHDGTSVGGEFSGTDITVTVTPIDGDLDDDGFNPDDCTPLVDCDCDDTTNQIFPGQTEVCDDVAAGAAAQIDSDCDGSTTDIEVVGGVDPFDDFDNDASPNCQDPDDDNDNDGDATDCNDFDNTVYNNASEVCDDVAAGAAAQIDSDCDGSTTDIGENGDGPTDPFGDFDGDLSPNCQDTNDDDDPSLDNADCNDYDTSVYDGAPEVCNDVVESGAADQIDSDCDGSTTDIEETGPSATAIDPFDDWDGDLSPNCQDTNDDGDPGPDTTDCDDFDTSIYLGAPEVCDDAVDSDCDGSITDIDETGPSPTAIDPFDDYDGDGHPNCTDEDDDGDGLPDDYEVANGLDPFDASDGSADVDLDGRDSGQEYQDGTDPNVYDGPDAPVNLTPPDGGFPGVVSPRLTVVNATSPVGDDLTYAFEVYSDVDLTTLVADTDGVSEDVDETGWTVAASLSEDGDFWWRAAAADDFVQGAWSEPTMFTVDLVGEDPTIPEPEEPLTGEILQVGEETVVWNDATSPEGRELEYDVRILQDDGLTVVTEATVEDTEAALEAWDIDAVLTSETFYGWQVRAVDQASRASAYSAVEFFGYDTDNQAPEATVFVEPTDGGSVDSLTPIFVVSESLDPEGGPVTHEFMLDALESFDSEELFVAELVGDGAGGEARLEFEPGVALTEHATYHARIQGRDLEGGVSGIDQIAFFVRGDNDPPSVPELVSPAPLFIVDSNPTLTSGEAVDPEGDAVSYEFIVAVDSGLTNVLATGTSTTTSFDVEETLAGGAWWSARSVDEHGAASGWAEPRWLVAEDPTWGTCVAALGPTRSPTSAALLLALLGLVGLRRRVQRP